MKEEVTKKVPRTDRMREILKVLEQGTNKDNPIRYSISPLMRYMAEQVQLAYEAGWNDSPPVATSIDDKANNYAKLKGFLI